MVALETSGFYCGVGEGSGNFGPFKSQTLTHCVEQILISSPKIFYYRWYMYHIATVCSELSLFSASFPSLVKYWNGPILTLGNIPVYDGSAVLIVDGQALSTPKLRISIGYNKIIDPS